MIGSFQKIRLAAANMGQAVLDLPDWVTASDPDYVEGERLSGLGMYADAETCFLKAISGSKSRSASRSRHPKILLGLANAQWKQGKLSEARDTVESARELLEIKRKPSSGLATCLDLLGSIQEESGELEDSRKRFREAFETQEKVFPLDPPVLIQRCRRLAKALRNASQQAEEFQAEPVDLLKRAIEIAEKHLGTHSPAAADCLMELGQLQMASGEKETGIASIERAMEIHRETFGQASEEVARDYQCLASACHMAGDLEKAVQYYERALSIRERQVGGNASDVGILLMGFADAQSLLGNDGPATELLQEAVGKLSSTGDERLAWALEYLGVNYYKAGRFGDAVGCHRKARVIWEKDLEANQEILEANAFRMDEAMIYAPPGTISSYPVPRRERHAVAQDHSADSNDAIETSMDGLRGPASNRPALLHPSAAIQRFIQGQPFQVGPMLVRDAGLRAQIPAQVAHQMQPGAQIPLAQESGEPAPSAVWQPAAGSEVGPIGSMDAVPLLVVGNGVTSPIAAPLTLAHLSDQGSENESGLPISSLQLTELLASGHQPLRPEKTLQLMVLVPNGGIPAAKLAAEAIVSNPDSKDAHLTGWDELTFDFLPSC